jgi:hypothetical protein
LFITSLDQVDPATSTENQPSRIAMGNSRDAWLGVVFMDTSTTPDRTWAAGFSLRSWRGDGSGRRGIVAPV